LRLAPEQSGICGFEFIDRVQFLSFSKEKLLRIKQVAKFSGEDFVLRSEDILRFN
jgi:hypothetical protein